VCIRAKRNYQERVAGVIENVAEKEKNNNPYYLLVVCSFYRAGLADEK